MTRRHAGNAVRRKAVFRGIMRDTVIAEDVNTGVAGADPHAALRVIHTRVARDRKIRRQAGKNRFGWCEANAVEPDHSALRAEPDVAFGPLPDTLHGPLGKPLLRKPDAVRVLGEREAWVERSRGGREGGRSQRQESEKSIGHYLYYLPNTCEYKAMSEASDLAGLFERDLKRLRQQALTFTDDQKLWALVPGISNSAGNLMLHLEGNLRDYIGRVLGGL